MEAQPDALPWMIVFQQQLLLECSDATAPTGSGPPPCSISLPQEGRSLWSVYQWGHQLIKIPDGSRVTPAVKDVTKTVEEPGNKKKLKSSTTVSLDPELAGALGQGGERQLPSSWQKLSVTFSPPLVTPTGDDGGMAALIELAISRGLGSGSQGAVILGSDAGKASTRKQSKRRDSVKPFALLQEPEWRDLLTQISLGLPVSLTANPHEGPCDPNVSSLVSCALTAAATQEGQVRGRGMDTLQCLIRSAASSGLGLAELLQGCDESADREKALRGLLRQSTSPREWEEGNMMVLELLRWCMTSGQGLSRELSRDFLDACLPSLSPNSSALIAATAASWPRQYADCNADLWVAVLGALLLPKQASVTMRTDLSIVSMPNSNGSLRHSMNLPAVTAVFGPKTSASGPNLDASSLSLVFPLVVSLARVASNDGSSSCDCSLHGACWASANSCRPGSLLTTASSGSSTPTAPSQCMRCTAVRSDLKRLCQPLVEEAVQHLLSGMNLNKDTAETSAGSSTETLVSLLPHADPLKLQEACSCLMKDAHHAVFGSQLSSNSAAMIGPPQQRPIKRSKVRGGLGAGEGPLESGRAGEANDTEMASHDNPNPPLVIHQPPSAEAVSLVSKAFLLAAACLSLMPNGEVLGQSQTLLSALLPHLGGCKDLLSARDRLLASALAWDSDCRRATMQKSTEQQPHARPETSLFDSKLWIQSVLAHPTLASATSAASMLHVGRLASRMLPEALDAAPTPEARKRALALLLPLVRSLLDHEAGGKQQLVALSAAYRPPLIAYMMRKRRTKPLPVASVDPPTAMQLSPADRDPAASSSVDPDIIAALKANAMPVLLSCIGHGPALVEAEKAKLMEKLLPKGERRGRV